ncbi:2-oxoglutarate oxidoreductase [bacterium]|nr:2-oxoglutarate oxidoreductase [bacterium]
MPDFAIAESLTSARTHYCPGCGHGIIHRALGEVIDEMGIHGDIIAVAPVGCAVIAYHYFNFDFTEAPHGRAPAVATGMKRAAPDKIIMTYQGDGDLLAIGLAETIHAANRGEKITIIFVNNGIYGMTGGQLAPTTLEGNKTLTTPDGRDPNEVGFPIDLMEMIKTFPGVKYLARGTVSNPGQVLRTKKYMKRALEVQQENRGFSLVEILSTCPTYWGMSPGESLDYVQNVVAEQFKTGVFKDE